MVLGLEKSAFHGTSGKHILKNIKVLPVFAGFLVFTIIESCSGA